MHTGRVFNLAGYMIGMLSIELLHTKRLEMNCTGCSCRGNELLATLTRTRARPRRRFHLRAIDARGRIVVAGYAEAEFVRD